MTRPLDEWADLKFLDGQLRSHIFEWGSTRSECGMTSSVGDWLGTGGWEEIETAKALPICGTCRGITEPDPAVEQWRAAINNFEKEYLQ